MLEPIFRPENEAARLDLPPGEEGERIARDKALLHRATTLAIESAFSFRTDFPIGAVAASKDRIVGQYFASDRRTGYKQAHAEYMAIMAWQISNMCGVAPAPDTLVISLEPCDTCQDFLATIPSLERVGFGLPRKAAETRGLVKPHEETIFERASRVELPYEVFQVEDPQLQHIGSTILDHTHRDPVTEEVEINNLGLQRALTDYMSA